MCVYINKAAHATGKYKVSQYRKLWQTHNLNSSIKSSKRKDIQLSLWIFKNSQFYVCEFIENCEYTVIIIRNLLAHEIINLWDDKNWRVFSDWLDLVFLSGVFFTHIRAVFPSHPFLQGGLFGNWYRRATTSSFPFRLTTMWHILLIGLKA